MRVSIELRENWEKGHFREFCERISKIDDVIMFIITTETNTNTVTSAGEILGLNTNSIISCSTDTIKKNQIIANQIDIHFDYDVDFSNDITNTTDSYGIYVSKFWDYFRMKMKYVSEFEFKVKLLNET